MNINKLKITIFLIMLSAAVFSGCSNVEVNGQIDSDFLVTYEGMAEFDLSKYSSVQQSLTQESLLKLSEYWKEAGYDSEVTVDGAAYTIYFTKQKQCQNYEEAFDALFKMMTGEYSPFTSLSYEFIPYENLSEYSISGSIDIHDFFDKEVLLNLNDDLQKQIDDEMKSSAITLNFILPNHNSFSDINNSPETFKIQLNKNSETDFEISGQVYNSEIAAKNSATVEKYKYYTNLKYALAAVLIIIVILTIVLLARTKKRKAK